MLGLQVSSQSGTGTYGHIIISYRGALLHSMVPQGQCAVRTQLMGGAARGTRVLGKGKAKQAIATRGLHHGLSAAAASK